MTEKITFTLDGKEVTASPEESIWEVSKREGTRIPHLCHLDQPGYRADGNCRACMVEIEGERVLAASCVRKPTQGMVVKTETERADKSRKMVFEMLAADMRPRAESPDSESDFWLWAESMGISGSDRFGSKFDDGYHVEFDISNPAIAVNMDACIACNACVRACREVQVNDVIGMGERGSHAVPVFDLADPDLVVGRRPVTNVPGQALMLMNNPFVMDCAEQCVHALRETSALTPNELVARIYWTLLARAPTEMEIERAVRFLKTEHDSAVALEEVKTERLSQLIHVLFASTEFRLLE